MLDVLRQHTAESYQALTQGQHEHALAIESARAQQELLAHRLDQVGASLSSVDQIDPLRQRVDGLAQSVGQGFEAAQTQLEIQEQRAQNLEHAVQSAQKSWAEETENFSLAIETLHQNFVELGGRIQSAEAEIEDVKKGGGKQAPR